MDSSYTYEPPTVDSAMTTAASASTGDINYEYSGAGAYTLDLMMTVVMVSYAFLFSVMLYSCMCTRHPAGFVQFDPEVPAPPKTGVVAELDQMWRKAFISKVYGIMSAQLFITFVISCSMMKFGGRDLIMWVSRDGSWTFTTSIVLMITTLIGLMCNRKRYPCNLILLLVFTVTMSFMVGLTCTQYAAAGLSTLVIEAFALTSIIFIGLTLFTIQSKIDFSFFGAGLGVALLALLMWGWFAMFAFPSFMFSQVYALAGSVIFSLYVVYDTWLITQTLSYDEYIVGAINLYLDFINLFLMILRLLTTGARE
eukprot:CAMPEP_0181226000 /NCGR_PEP_ID=MMETSP1096-20121128/32016_1 /TAXON_ID=156174 ORGANISM="Chrysochromulina ericina, Strain CCMP281" /NCGR_SAMPLE_ID=MMETSP1096 /ASSEMBLY_ACC=CAM_ASM_000453 /LENGTH=309 /DNA_ID=CAMNT_0023319299 /DNA_START=20 /DNA_END=949 /DNA_ORIENTATION=-